MNGIKIISTGSYAPPNKVDNHKLSETVDTNHQWIVERTGIHSRNYAGEITNTEMATNAARKALEASGIDKDKVKVVIVATFTPDNFTPSTASLVQKELGLGEDVFALDVNSACTGFVNGLKVAQGLLQEEGVYGIVVGSEKISPKLDFEDRGTCIIFGDGAGAAVVTTDTEHVNQWVYGSRGDDQVLYCRAIPTEEDAKCCIHMDGKEVFRFATEKMRTTVESLCEKSNTTPADYQHIVCHQANERIITHTCKKLKGKPEQFYMNIADYGNTSAASIPIALDELNQKGAFKSGDNIILVGFGSGLAWGGTTLRWY